MMNLRECYETIGGDYDEVLGRLCSERLVQKFVLMFLDDKSYEQLWDSMESGDRETAFRAAHTIKGICQNLAFTRLYESDHQLTEALRAGEMEQASVLIEKVKEDYEHTVAAIRAFQDFSPSISG